MMNAMTVEVGGTQGMIFEGEIPDTYCFVPEDCIHEEGGEAKITEVDYVRSHWDERNMRVSAETEGKRLFPKPDRPVDDLRPDRVRAFLARIRGAASGLEAGALNDIVVGGTHFRPLAPA